MSDQLTFGQTVRAYRLGWRWSDRLQGLLRMSPTEKGMLVQLHPAGLVPSKTEVKNFVAWWEDVEIIDACAPLRSIKRVKKPISFFVHSETGELL